MSRRQDSPRPSARPPNADALRQQLDRQPDAVIGFCFGDPAPTSFLELENALWELLQSLGCLLI
jgi:hypothetical protein